MKTTESIIEHLRTQGLTDYQILEQLDEAKGQLDIISAQDLLAQAQQINPKYTRHAIYKQITRNMKSHARKIGGTWWIERQAAEDCLEQARNKPSNF